MWRHTQMRIWSQCITPHFDTWLPHKYTYNCSEWTSRFVDLGHRRLRLNLSVQPKRSSSPIVPQAPRSKIVFRRRHLPSHSRLVSFDTLLRHPGSLDRSQQKGPGFTTVEERGRNESSTHTKRWVPVHRDHRLHLRLFRTSTPDRRLPRGSLLPFREEAPARPLTQGRSPSRRLLL